jgi:hypothetical protein
MKDVVLRTRPALGEKPSVMSIQEARLSSSPFVGLKGQTAYDNTVSLDALGVGSARSLPRECVGQLLRGRSWLHRAAGLSVDGRYAITHCSISNHLGQQSRTDLLARFLFSACGRA